MVKNSAPLFLLAALASAAMVDVPAALAEVSSAQCPYDCDTQRIPRSQCKDWRENGLCYIDDLRPAASRPVQDSDPDAERDITPVNKTIAGGSSTTVELHDRPIVRIDVVARSESGSSSLLATFEKGESFGGPQEVNGSGNQVLRWNVGSRNPKGKELVLQTLSGSVFVESVHVFYR